MSTVEPEAKGTWRQVAAIIDGRNVPVGPGALLTVTADGYTVTVNGKMYQRGTSKTDYHTTPRQSDVVVTEGPQAGQTFHQIFRIEGDVLIACMAAAGAARPTEFTSTAGSGRILSVWLRTPDATVSKGALRVFGVQPLTWRTWLIVAVLVLLAAVAGATSEDLGASLGPWAGILAGVLAGALFLTAVVLMLRWDWQTALTTGVTVAVASNTFDRLKPALNPTLGALGTVFVSASTAIVAGAIVAVVLAGLLKVRR